MSMGADVVRGRSETAVLLGMLRRDRSLCQVAKVLTFATLGIIFLYVLAGFWEDQSVIARAIRHNFNLGLDDMVAENFNHGLAFLAATLLFLSFVEVRSRAMLFLTALYGFIWFDDSASFHERAGEKIGKALDLPMRMGLGPQEQGELLAWGIGGIFVGLVFLWFWRGRRRGDLGAVIPFLMCFVALVVFGVVVDMLHAVISPRYGEAAGVIEDGGEMLAIVASAALALGLSRNAPAYYQAIDTGPIDTGPIDTGPID